MRRKLAWTALPSLLAVAALALAAAPARGDQAAARQKLEKAGLAFTPDAFLEQVARGEAADVALFLEAGIDPAATSASGWTALWIATNGKRADTLRAILAAGVKPTGTNAPPAEYGKTIVHEAVDTGDPGIVRALVEAGADAKQANEFGVPPLAEAARTGQLETCKILLAAGADPNAAPGGYPLLFGPVIEDRPEVVALLLKAGAKLGEHKETMLKSAKSPAVRALLEAAE
jgi:ankyrin repeat protein